MGAQGKGLRTSEQVETRRQGKSVWSGYQYRPLDGTGRLRLQVCIRVQHKRISLAYPQQASTTYILSTEGQASLTLRVSSGLKQEGGGSVQEGVRSLVGKEVRQWKVSEHDRRSMRQQVMDMKQGWERDA